nr:leucine-rich repeat domain-containing protein [bacterium]
MYDGNKSIIAAALLSTLVNLSAGAGPSLNPQLEYQPAEVENSPASGSDRNQPNLTSYTPTGWDLPIVPSSVPGTNTLNTLYGSRDTFVDWAVINDGNEDITQTFSTALLIDDSLYVYWNSASLQSGWYCYIEDYVTFLSDGAHELKLVADYFDDITEASESDNECTYGFYWQTPTQHVPDPNFKAAINDKLGKPVWYDPTIADLNALTGILWAIWVDDIYSISGAQYLIHLDDLRLQDNQIYNLSPISGLTNLEELYLSRNQIINIYPVSGLVNLTHLYLEDNDITDITAVSGLTNLNYLNLESNQISSIAAVSGLENLYRLQLSENQIADISAVSNLTNLSELYLSHNQISDISATAGLTNLTYLQLASNQITDITAIPNLINLTDLFLSNNHIIDIPAFPEMMSLEELHLSHNEILDISALSSVASLSYIFLDGNQINDISAISSLLNLRRLYIYGNRITDIYPLVENIEFGASDRLYLESEEQSNPLSLEAVMVHITLLQSRGFWALEYPEIPDLNAPCYPDPARNQIGFIASNNLQWRGNFPFREVVYDVWLSESSDNLINVGTGTAFDDTLYYFTPVLDPYTEYWWKIRAVTEGDTLWSGLWHFTTGDDDGFFADFMADQTIAVVGSEVQFTDLSHGNPTSWNWDFESDGIVDATNQNPTWIYNEAGIYSVSLEIYDDRNYDMETKTDYITVLPISPEIEVTPTELEVILFTGTATTENLIIHNVGTEDLIWQAEVDIALERDETPLNGSDYYPDPGLDKGEVDPRRGVPVDRDSGGPDGFGHYWKDSNDENGPVYSWDDISTTGIPVTEWTSIGGFPVMDEGYAGPIDVGFDFPFYDQTYSSLYLSTNGFIEFDLTTAFSWTNQP